MRGLPVPFGLFFRYISEVRCHNKIYASSLVKSDDDVTMYVMNALYRKVRIVRFARWWAFLVTPSST